MGNGGRATFEPPCGAKIGVTRLSGDDFCRAMGYDGRHALRSEDYSEAEKYELAGNAMSTATSEKLAIAAKAYYDPAWHARHVRELWRQEGREFSVKSSPQTQRLNRAARGHFCGGVETYPDCEAKFPGSQAARRIDP